MRSVVNRYIAPIVAAVALAAYWPVALAVEDNFQAELLRAGQATVMTVAFLFFVGALRRAFGMRVPDSARRFYLGLILWASAADGGAVWRLFWRMAGGGDDLDWMLTNDTVNFLLWIEIVGVFFMLSGPAVPTRDPDSDLPGDTKDGISWRRVVLAAALCVGVSYLVVVQRLGGAHIRTVLELLKPA